MKKKNVILITIDALRKDTFGIYGSKNMLTPFMDSLKEKCMIFTRAQATGPYTQSSFQGILASSYYLEYGKEKKLSEKKILISEVLKSKKITTAAFHSNAYLSYYFGYNRGWNTFYDSMNDKVTDIYPFIRGDEINRKVDSWLSDHTTDKEYSPFFLWVHYMDVHEPYIAEEKYLNMIDPSINLKKEEMFDLFKNVILKRDISDMDTVKILKKLYMAKVAETDSYVKDLFSSLKKYNVLDESTVIITSDHGDEFSEHGGLSHDGKMYSELLDVPLLVYNTNRAREKMVDSLVSLIDISPTIAYLFKAGVPQVYKGATIIPVDEYKERVCYGEAMGKVGNKEKDTDKPIYYLRQGDLKIIYKEAEKSWEMYDLAKDPKEKNNIVENSYSNSLKEKLTPMISRWEK